LSGDVPLAQLYAASRALRIADGPDDVHLESVARRELGRHQQRAATVERIRQDG
jgi:acyl-CoA dehydrogenase